MAQRFKRQGGKRKMRRSRKLPSAWLLGRGYVSVLRGEERCRRHRGDSALARPSGVLDSESRSFQLSTTGWTDQTALNLPLLWRAAKRSDFSIHLTRPKRTRRIP